MLHHICSNLLQVTNPGCPLSAPTGEEVKFGPTVADIYVGCYEIILTVSKEGRDDQDTKVVCVKPGTGPPQVRPRIKCDLLLQIKGQVASSGVSFYLYRFNTTNGILKYLTSLIYHILESLDIQVIIIDHKLPVLVIPCS